MIPAGLTPKAFTTEARAAIDAQRGALYDAIFNAFVAGNPNADNSDGPALLKYFANPNSVSLIYSAYKLRLPTHVTVNGHRIRILEPDETLEDRRKAIGSFNIVFGGIQGWLKHREQYEELGYSYEQLERLAVRWLEGDWNNAEFFNECKRVPGFDRQLAAVSVSEDGQWASDEDMLHLAGYKQLKAQYAREGGNPEAMDEMMRAFLSGDEARYQQLRQKFEGKRRMGCLTVILLVLTMTFTTYCLR
jgi:hypothetical protein